MVEGSESVLIRGDDGTVYNLKEFVTFLRESEVPNKTVASICADAGMSRANYYFLMAGGQTPTIESLVALFTALGAKISAPLKKREDLLLECRSGSYVVNVKMKDAERAKARKRLVATQVSDLTSPAGMAAVLTAVRAFGPLGLPVLPFAPAAAAALVYAGIKMAQESANSDDESPTDVSHERFREEIASLTTEEIEEVIVELRRLAGDQEES